MYVYTDTLKMNNVKVKTKNTFKYDNVPGFLFCLKNE